MICWPVATFRMSSDVFYTTYKLTISRQSNILFPALYNFNLLTNYTIPPGCCFTIQLPAVSPYPTAGLETRLGVAKERGNLEDDGWPNHGARRLLQIQSGTPTLLQEEPRGRGPASRDTIQYADCKLLQRGRTQLMGTRLCQCRGIISGHCWSVRDFKQDC
jgi:hypothetical protein